jgi:hypothetical protein
LNVTRLFDMDKKYGALDFFSMSFIDSRYGISKPSLRQEHKILPLPKTTFRNRVNAPRYIQFRPFMEQQSIFKHDAIPHVR